MATIEDFRLYTEFTQPRVSQSGRIVGSTIYWKLYSIENLLRVLIDSILSVNYPRPKWPDYVLSPSNKEDVEYRRQQHKTVPWNSTRGEHALYYLDLADLGSIILATDTYLSPVIEDVDGLVRAIATIKQPRNVVAHMSFPSKDDKSQVDNLYTQVVSLVREVDRKSKIKLRAPK